MIFHFRLFDLFPSFLIWFIYQCLSLSIGFYQAPCTDIFHLCPINVFHHPIPMKIWNGIGPRDFLWISNSEWSLWQNNVILLKKKLFYFPWFCMEFFNFPIVKFPDTLELDQSSWHQRHAKKTSRILFQTSYQITSKSFALSDTLIS